MQTDTQRHKHIQVDVNTDNTIESLFYIYFHPKTIIIIVIIMHYIIFWAVRIYKKKLKLNRIKQEKNREREGKRKEQTSMSAEPKYATCY